MQRHRMDRLARHRITLASVGRENPTSLGRSSTRSF
ncbi:hypothetical protein ACKOZO_002901 [Vibrio vulnificus]